MIFLYIFLYLIIGLIITALCAKYAPDYLICDEIGDRDSNCIAFGMLWIILLPIVLFILCFIYPFIFVCKKFKK